MKNILKPLTFLLLAPMLYSCLPDRVGRFSDFTTYPADSLIKWYGKPVAHNADSHLMRWKLANKFFFNPSITDTVDIMVFYYTNKHQHPQVVRAEGIGESYAPLLAKYFGAPDNLPIIEENMFYVRLQPTSAFTKIHYNKSQDLINIELQKPAS